MTALAFVLGLIAGAVLAVVMVAVGYMREKQSEKAEPEPPASLARDWRMWREHGQTMLELRQMLLRANGKGFHATFTVTYAKGSDHGEEMWASYLERTDSLADASLGQVKMPVEVEE